MKWFAFRESLLMSLRSIASNKIRSLLTALGVMIGVAAVIALVALGNGAQISVEQSLESLGSNLLLVYSGEPRGGSLVRRNTTSIKPTLTDEDIETIRSFGPNLVTAVTPEATATGQLKYGNINTVATVVGTGVDYPEIRNFHPLYGNFFSQLDVDTRKTNVVIGMQIYRDLFPEGIDPVGERIRINGINHRVVGIMEEKGSSTSDSSVFIPISTYQRYISGEQAYAVVNVQATSTEVMRDLQTAIENGILRNHRLPTMDTADFYVANQLDLLDTMQGVTETFTLLLASIAAISLIVGGIGIMNIMLVSVTERTREIGVRMALGATGADIMRQFMTEAVIISLLGGLVGIAIGIGAAWGAERFGGMAAQVSGTSVAMAFGFAFVIGLFFGGYPAYRASRLDPIEALRYE
ncbi:MAG: ABC transporter permease [Spirochaeta sp.]|jgi:putative ABC transport system permease protein|nr:ABC transporter permease [Spirochaeta sp.]